MRYSSLGMMILKFIQDSASTADNDRYSFTFKVSLKSTSELGKVQYVAVAVPTRTDANIEYLPSLITKVGSG
jgi:hypothetical protein